LSPCRPPQTCSEFRSRAAVWSAIRSISFGRKFWTI
jgi:hypothetical protein